MSFDSQIKIDQFWLLPGAPVVVYAITRLFLVSMRPMNWQPYDFSYLVVYWFSALLARTLVCTTFNSTSTFLVLSGAATGAMAANEFALQQVLLNAQF